ncbi:MAG: electron transport complex subunit RsxC [Pseudomonadota bacterium]
MRTLYKFNGGVHPPQHKAESTRQPILAAPLPALLTVPLQQHIGAPAKALVRPGDRVLKGQMIARAEGNVSAAVHAPTSGTVRTVEMRAVPHPSGLRDLCVEIEVDGEERWIERRPLDANDPGVLRHRLRESGVVGLGGAVFPSFIKLNPGNRQKIQTLVINGAECEPYITCDDMLMRERADEIVQGIALMRYMLNAQEVVVGIEDNKPEAIAAMRAAATQSDAPIEVVTVPTIYPGGGAKQLVRVLTGIEVAADARSLDFGVQCFNVATAYAVHRAVHHDEPALSRIVTITGNVAAPRNYEALIGTPIAELLRHAGEKPDTTGHLMGGPMMGFDLPATGVPLTKATNCVIAKSRALFPPAPAALPCIRCGECARACPADLQPMDLYWFAKSRNFGKAQEFALFDCIECGCCSYVCPSHIPLVQYFRFAKSEIHAREKEKKAADTARERHEFRLFRIEREKHERAERLAQKATEKLATLQAEAPSAETNAKQAAILAAIERAQAKKAGIIPRNIDNLPPEKLAEIAEIEARRAQMAAMAQTKDSKAE